jgi:hypothetical protein
VQFVFAEPLDSGSWDALFEGIQECAGSANVVPEVGSVGVWESDGDGIDDDDVGGQGYDVGSESSGGDGAAFTGDGFVRVFTGADDFSV